MVRIPRVLIAGTQSGAGKTTVAIGVMAALAKRGIAVQPFKVGPDYIDPTYHALVSGRISRNLDTWLLTAALIRGVVQRAAADADVAIIEGVMGLFDGHASTNDRGSTAELAKWLRAPVILVVDASHMARSAAALVQGYLTFDPAVRVAGVIFNNVSEGHFRLLRESLRRYTDVPALGYLAHDPALAIPERHLGLVPAMEDATIAPLKERLAEAAAQSLDLERIMQIAKHAAPLPRAALSKNTHGHRSRVVRIGVARDRAFHFYYQENLELLQAYGAELIHFSPLNDQQLPEKLDALYLGGGFPEMFASELAQNAPLRIEVKRAVSHGLPTYAECGGLMYLVEQLYDQQGNAHAMVGALPGSVRMTDRLQHFGYVTITPVRKNILATRRDPIKGHEFHRSVWEYAVPDRDAAYTAVQRGGRRREGFARDNILASYIHVHFLTNVRWARGLVATAQRWRAQRDRTQSLEMTDAESMMGSLCKSGAAPQL